MFSFFKRKKPSDDKAQESSSSSDAHLPADTPDDNPAAEPALPVTVDTAAESSAAPHDQATEPLAVKGDGAAEPSTVADNAAQGSDTAAVTPSVGSVANESVDNKVSAASKEVSDAQTPGPGQAAAWQNVSPQSSEPELAQQGVSPQSAEPALTRQVPAEEPVSAGLSSVSGDQVDVEEAVTPVDARADEPAQSKGSWLVRLKKGLSRTGQSIGGLFVDVKLDDDLYEELETALIMADAGVEATTQLLGSLRTRVRKERLTDAMQARAALRDILTEHLKPLEKDFPLGSVKPLIMMIAGVNGAGKTTSIGKLANTFQAEGAQVLLAAGDTFRAAAREQLLEWGSRNNVTVIAQEGGDPAAVAFDAVNAGRARQADVVMIDTAGRLPTQLHLMEELKKIKRVVNKADGNAPHEVLLVVDGNSGQNVIAQIRAFDAAIGLTGLVVTKLDGTAKGGILAAVAAGSQGVRPVPVYWIGVGESIHDLQPFRAHEFSAALVGDTGHAQK